jgi:hypothetical protein
MTSMVMRLKLFGARRAETLTGKYSTKYEYDLHGNWVKQTSFKKDKPLYIFERELTYFSE